MTRRAVTYARFSSDLQNPRSAADQTRACQLYAEAQGWVVVGSYEDHAISGASVHRPGFAQLVADAGAGRFDVVVTEGLDRLSRKLADIATLHERLGFLGIPIHTIQHGVITPMHIGLVGTMSQLHLSDLRAKTRRGLRAVAEGGRSAGGLTYGYRVVGGDAPRGRREIDPVQAEVVRRIFRDYAAGLSPKRIALALNEQGLPGPRGGAWAPSAINGDRGKGTGILNNELYIGRQVWGRRTWIKHPETGRRLARRAAAAEAVVTEIPELRIVADELWAAAKARQEALDRKGATTGVEAPKGAFWAKQRPRYLFSGLMVCGACGGGFSKISAAHFGCSTARNKGPTACTNRLTVRRDHLEETVLGALRERLMDPDLFRDFVAEFTATWNRLQAEASAGLTTKRAKLERVQAGIDRAVDAIVAGTASSSLKARLEELERRKAALEAELAGAEAPAPRLHPNLAEVYRERIAELSRALESEDAAQAREVVRGLVEAIRLVPEVGQLRIEVRGALGAILALAEGARNDKRLGCVAEALLVQIKMDAGTGFEPVTFRL
ncbi:recombinase family protein [Falsiroseomonas oryziterrae]|uniref:recombinase family protein n=1 Tax=Falsiroseomonas oryziterrae TaxID=2911368 RepID=UPI001F15D31D|nr:recombinase family protein [Roseomonas sp. NPKOSM-4]